MGKVLDELTPELIGWIRRQHVFFVATAPLDEGAVNLSPKGYDTFTVVSPRRVAYLDLTGSGIETVAHLRQSSRITVMFCAFEGPPRILRLYGEGRVHLPGDAGFTSLREQFPDRPGARSIITIDLERISTSCGYSLPLLEYRGDRSVLDDWAGRKGEDGIVEYWSQRNGHSIDGLPGLPGPVVAVEPANELTEGARHQE
jgi:hypothetical protein